MRKNPTHKEQLKDDLRVLGFSFSLYLISYWLGYHSLCILSMATMNIITFQAGITFHEAYSKPIHLNQFDELDSSMEADAVDDSDNLSIKQKEQGATTSRCLTEEQEEKVNEQFRAVVEETTLRNRKRNSLNTARTPSSTTLVEDGEISPAKDEGDYDDMPGLISPDEVNSVTGKKYSVNMTWSEVPNFSQTHYLHNNMDEVD
jgi:hypothetical protein